MDKKKIEFKIIDDRGETYLLAVYINGERAGTAIGYRHGRTDRVEIYPKLLDIPYNTTENIAAVRTFRYRRELPYL